MSIVLTAAWVIYYVCEPLCAEMTVRLTRGAEASKVDPTVAFRIIS